MLFTRLNFRVVVLAGVPPLSCPEALPEVSLEVPPEVPPEVPLPEVPLPEVPPQAAKDKSIMPARRKVKNLFIVCSSFLLKFIITQASCAITL